MVSRFRRRRRRRKTSSKALVSKIKSVVSRQIETKRQRKMVDGLISGSGVAISTTPHYTPVLFTMGLSSGTESNQYIGDVIRLQYLKCRGAVQQADSRNLIRLALIRARANFSFQNGDMEPFLTSDLAPTPLYVSWSTKYVSQVLYDRVFNLNASSGDDNELMYIRKNFNLHNQRVKIIGLNDYATELYWVVVSDSSVATHPTFLMNMELSWKDA